MTLDMLGIVIYRQFDFWDNVGAKMGEGIGRENVRKIFWQTPQALELQRRESVCFLWIL